VKSNADLAVSATTTSCNCGGIEPKPFYAALAGGWNWYRYWSPAHESLEVIEAFAGDALVVDVADIRARRVVWWGTANETVSDSVKHINRRIAEMFSSFPPGA